MRKTLFPIFILLFTAVLVSCQKKYQNVEIISKSSGDIEKYPRDIVAETDSEAYVRAYNMFIESKAES